MPDKAPIPHQNAGNLRGRDKKQDRLRDTRHGAYDPVGAQTQNDASQRTPHEDAQPGADVRGDPNPASGFKLPEGLRRQRMGPYDKDRGRGN